VNIFLIIRVGEKGVQARPGAHQFMSEISLLYKSKRVNLKSIMGVMSLAISEGPVITISI
jgi:phosphocarrier protein